MSTGFIVHLYIYFTEYSLQHRVSLDAKKQNKMCALLSKKWLKMLESWIFVVYTTDFYAVIVIFIFQPTGIDTVQVMFEFALFCM